MPAKSFAASPAMQFISRKPEQEAARAVPEQPAAPEEAAGARYSERRELKTKRVQLLLKPSVHARIKKMAAEQDLSFNDYVNRILEREALGA